MFQRKGIAELIEAFEQVAKRFPSAHLYLVGDGSDRPAFETQAASSSVSTHIHFEGFQSNPKPYLLAAEVFVLASLRDSCPLVISEAREVGCAIVASNVDGIPEQLDEGQSGILVPPGDVPALANAIESLLASSTERDKWKRAALQNLERLTVANMVEEVAAVYHELLGNAHMKTALHLQLSVGNGLDKALFEAKAQNTPVADRIHFEGFQPEPQCYLLSTDIFVLASYKDPSQW
jgi:glycosyltransferase involved in cell wall biosynthesis